MASFHRYPKFCESLTIVFVFGMGFLWYHGRTWTVSFKPLVVIQTPLAVFILEDALSVWTNYLPLFVLNDGQRKIVRPDG